MCDSARADICVKELKSLEAQSPRKTALRHLWAAHACRATYEKFLRPEVSLSSDEISNHKACMGSYLDSAERHYLASIRLVASAEIIALLNSLPDIAAVPVNSFSSLHRRLLSEAFAGLCVIAVHRSLSPMAVSLAVVSTGLRPQSVGLINCARILAVSKNNSDLALRLTGSAILPVLGGFPHTHEFLLWNPTERLLMLRLSRRSATLRLFLSASLKR